jgi:hypothetical protein
MFSALPSNSDIARRSRHVSKVPIPEVVDQLRNRKIGPVPEWQARLRASARVWRRSSGSRRIRTCRGTLAGSHWPDTTPEPASLSRQHTARYTELAPDRSRTSGDDVAAQLFGVRSQVSFVDADSLLTHKRTLPKTTRPLARRKMPGLFLAVSSSRLTILRTSSMRYVCRRRNVRELSQLITFRKSSAAPFARATH